MSRLARFFLVLAMIAAASPAHADLDQHCLAACINAGQDESVCLPQCSYNLKPKPAAPAAAPQPTPEPAPGTGDPNRVLKAPRPADDAAMPAQPAPVAAPVATTRLDRVCLAACLQKNFAYDLCTERCTRQDCIGSSCQDGPSLTPNAAETPLPGNPLYRP